MECRKEKVSVFGFEGTPSEKQQSMTELKKSEAFRKALRSKDIFLDSSMVEHSAVNRVVVGSSPTRGARGMEDLKRLKERRSEDAIDGAPWSSG